MSLRVAWTTELLVRLVYRVTFCLKYINKIIRGKTQHVASHTQRLAPFS